VERLSEKEKLFIVGLEKLTRETGVTINAESYDVCDLSLIGAAITSDESGYGFDSNGLTWLDPSDKEKTCDYESGNGLLVERWSLFKNTIVKPKGVEL
jgi:hypothetical protein